MPTPYAVAHPLLCHMRVIRESRKHRLLDRPGNHHARVLANLEQPAHQGRVARHERGAVAGHAALLAQRVDREQSVVTAATHPWVEDARDGSRNGQPRRAPASTITPVQLGITLIAGDDHAVLPGPPDDRGEVFMAKDLPGGVA